MRIILFGPDPAMPAWRELGAAAASAGHVVATAMHYDELHAAPHDLVLIADGLAPRLTDTRTLSVLVSGLAPLLEARSRFENMLGCDAVLALDGATEAWLIDLSLGLGRELAGAPGTTVADGPPLSRILHFAGGLPTSQDEPAISVIIRCGGRERQLARAVASVARQDHGRFEIIFARHRPVDIAAIMPARAGAIASHRVVDVAPGSRGAALQAGLRAASRPLFAVLDDDDWWLAHHARWLLAGLAGTAPGAPFLAYSGSFAVPLDETGRPDPKPFSFGMRPGFDWFLRAGAMTSNCYIASTALAQDYLRQPVEMHLGEDMLLHLQLMQATRPWFSYAATAFFDRAGGDHSVDWNQADVAGMAEGVAATLRVAARMGRNLPAPQPGPDLLTELRRVRLVGGDRAWVRGLPAGEPPRRTEHAARRVVVAGIDAARSNCPPPSAVLDAAAGRVGLVCGATLHSHAAYLALPASPPGAAAAVLELDVEVEAGHIGFWLWDVGEAVVLSRVEPRAGGGRMVWSLALPDAPVGRLVVVEMAAGGGSRGTLHGLRLLEQGPGPDEA